VAVISFHLRWRNGQIVLICHEMCGLFFYLADSVFPVSSDTEIRAVSSFFFLVTREQHTCLGLRTSKNLFIRYAQSGRYRGKSYS